MSDYKVAAIGGVLLKFSSSGFDDLDPVDKMAEVSAGAMVRRHDGEPSMIRIRRTRPCGVIRRALLLSTWLPISDASTPIPSAEL